MLSDVWINTDGEQWRPDIWSAAASNRIDTSPQSSPGTMLLTEGNIKISSTRVGCIITFDYQQTSIVGLIGAIIWLAEHRPERVAIENIATAAESLPIASVAHAIRFLSQLCDTRRNIPKYLRQSVTLSDSVFATRHEAAREILVSDIDIDIRMHFLSKLFQEHFIIAERDSSSGHYLLQKSGKKLDRYFDDLGPLRPGQPFTVLDDNAFGQWIADGLFQFKGHDAACVEYLEAQFQLSKKRRPSESRPLHYSYTRLVVPFQRDGRDHLLTAAVFA